MIRCLSTGIEAIRFGSLPLDPGTDIRTTEIYGDLFETKGAPNHRYNWNLIDLSEKSLIFANQIYCDRCRSTFRRVSPRINRARCRSPDFSLGFISRAPAFRRYQKVYVRYTVTYVTSMWSSYQTCDFQPRPLLALGFLTPTHRRSGFSSRSA